MSYIAPDTDIYLLVNVECDKSYYDGTATGILTATVSTVTGGTESVKWTKTGGTATGTIASNGVWKAETAGTLKAKASIGTMNLPR